MARPFLLALGLLGGGLLVGCSSSNDAAGAADAPSGPDVTSSPRAVSGSRLRAKVVQGGGVSEPLGFFDSARSEDCTFQKTSDGRYRCLPAIAGNTGQSNPTYADAACTKLAAVVSTCGAAKYVAVFGAAGSTQCGGAPGISGIRPVAGAATQLYVSNGGSCAGQPQPANANVSLVALGDEIPLDQFVAADEMTLLAGTVSETVLVATDGARQHMGYFADALGAECTFQIMADGAARCAPQAFSSQVLYSDSSCTQGALAYAGSFGNACTSAAFVRDGNSANACDAPRGIYRVEQGEESPPGTFYRQSPPTAASAASCDETSSRGSYAPAQRVTDVTASLPEGGRIGPGEGRLRPALVAASGSSLTRGWHDTEKHVDCAFVKASDGKIRCMPTAPAGVVFFTDTKCASPARVGVRSATASCTDATSRFIRVDDAPATCTSGATTVADAPTTRIFELTGERRNVSGASWQSAPGRCAQLPAVNGASDVVELNPAEFVEGTIVTE